MPHLRSTIRISLFAVASLVLASVGCHSEDPSVAVSNAAAISGDVAKNAALAKADTERAFALLQKGRYAEAEPLLNRAVAADVTYGPAHNDLGLIYYQRDDLYNAAWQFENAIKLMPGQAQPQNNLGLVLEKSGKSPEALKAFSRACELDPGNPEFAGNLASLRIRLGMRDETTARLLGLVMQRDTRAEWVQWARFNLIRNQNAPAAESPASHPVESLP